MAEWTTCPERGSGATESNGNLLFASARCAGVPRFSLLLREVGAFPVTGAASVGCLLSGNSGPSPLPLFCLNLENVILSVKFSVKSA
jgi:hypothetical protein